MMEPIDEAANDKAAELGLYTYGDLLEALVADGWDANEAPRPSSAFASARSPRCRQQRVSGTVRKRRTGAQVSAGVRSRAEPRSTLNTQSGRRW